MEIKCTKSRLVEELLMLGNESYSLKDREALRAVYDVEDVAVLLMMGRQFGKSTFIASSMLANTVARPFFKTLYVSPRQDQSSEFSSAKLQPFIKYSPKLRAILIDRDSQSNVWKKTFSNGGEITLKYAYHTADAIRGVSADQTMIDELQDIIYGNIPVIEECLSGSKYQWRAYAGTPKTWNNTLAQKWGQSTQNERLLKCTGCNKWNTITIESIGPNGLVCKKCGKEIPRDAPAEWVARKVKGGNIFLTGFRLPQVLSPMVKWPMIVEKLRTYPTVKFMNEVLALPYDNSANPLTETDLRKICGVARNQLEPRSENAGYNFVLGVDWGHGDISVGSRTGAPTGYTVVSIGMVDYAGKFHLVGMKRFSGLESEPAQQVETIMMMAKRLGAVAIGADFGGGFLHNSILKRDFGTDRVIEWQANDSIRSTSKYYPDLGRVIFNRTECMTERFVEIRNQDVQFMCWEDFKEFAEDFLTITVDYRANGRDMYYSHVLPDDAFHAYMICKMTADYILNL